MRLRRFNLSAVIAGAFVVGWNVRATEAALYFAGAIAAGAVGAVVTIVILTALIWTGGHIAIAEIKKRF